jgi:hypothetical protein
MTLSTRWALFLYGRRAKRLLEEARADLASTTLPDAVAKRARIPLASARRRRTLLQVQRAVGGVLAREGETHPCLVRALALLGDARRHGYAPSIAVGVRREGDAVQSHAWLVLDGKPFLESHETPERFAPITVLP